MRDTCAALLDVEPDTLAEFATPDAFNPGNTLAGFICRQSDHRYGALVILMVNGVPVSPQVVYCTPKLHYPFGVHDDGERAYHWPKVVRGVYVYPKLDGTNICAYSYADAAGNRFLTYKTRLTPVVQESRFGPFESMWREMLQAHPEVLYGLSGVMDGRITVSFEMYGYRNRHLILYPQALDAKALFFVTQHDGAAHPPDEESVLPLALVPEAILSSQHDVTLFYEQMRDKAEAMNRKVRDDSGENLIEGTEGFVFYVLDGDGHWHLMKCKPASVEDIHWAGDVIPMSRILPTAWNGLESCAEEGLTVEALRTLLLEEFSPTVVNASQAGIEKAVTEVRAQVAWRDKVRQAYIRTSLNWSTDGKGPVMRALSREFAGSEMRQVFSALRHIGVAT